jgi:small ligand-binding sensory domain FIST
VSPVQRLLPRDIGQGGLVRRNSRSGDTKLFVRAVVVLDGLGPVELSSCVRGAPMNAKGEKDENRIEFMYMKRKR